MKPAAFDYHCPRTLDEVLDLLAEHGPDAKPLAGGQSLIPAMNFRLATPAVLVDLNKVAGLSHLVHAAPDGMPGLHLGAMTRHRELERSAMVAQHAPLVSAAMPFVAHAAIRTRGTLGGSLAHADPAAELPAVMLALDARVTLSRRDGSRVVAADAFFTGLFATALEPGELLTAVTVPPRPPRSAFAFLELSRRHGDFALAGVAVAVATDDTGRVSAARIALLSVGDRAVLARDAAEALVGQAPGAEAIRAAAAAVDRDIDPPGDIHASSRYRRHLAGVLTRRALTQAFATLERP